MTRRLPTRNTVLWTAVLLLPIAASGCGSPSPHTPDHCDEDDRVCEPIESSVYAPASGSNGRVGSSVAVATWGLGNTATNTLRSVVSGAPSAGGSIRISDANPYTGLLDTSVGSRNQTITPPAGGVTEYDFGYTAFTSDIRQCTSTPGNYCGEEILVGAPDLGHTTRGLALWYYPSAGGGTGNFVYGGTVTPRSGLATGAEFGYSFAAFADILNVEEPWIVAPDHPDWVAIGAPGAGTVEIYSVNPASGTPLGSGDPSQVLTGPDSGRRFGHAIVAGDFNDDGYADLAVGAPNPITGSPEGRVYVFRGASSGPTWFPMTALVLTGYSLTGTSMGDVQTDKFGWALDAGPFTGGQYASRSSLVVGAPLNSWVGAAEDDEEQGAVCTFVLGSTEGGSGLTIVSEHCFPNPWNDERTVTSENFGQAVSVGNYVNQDKSGLMDTDNARLHEVAVGVPGYDSARGEVAVFLTNEEGLRITTINTLVYEYPDETAGARFGQSLAGGYIQESGWEDLAVGAPDHPYGSAHDGRTTLTKALAPEDCPTIYGIWEVVDANTVPRKVEVQEDAGGNTRLVFLEDFAAEVREEEEEGEGDICVATWDDENYDLKFDFPRGLVISLDGAWCCEETTDSWSDVPADDLVDLIAKTMGVDTESDGWETAMGILPAQYMDVTLTLDVEESPYELTIIINTDDMSWGILGIILGTDSSCRLAKQPMDGTQLTSGTCED